MKPDAPLLLVDSVLFRRVFDSLLENAHKYSSDVAAPGSAAQGSQGTSGVVFEVEDRGIGIPEEDRAHVFTPFFRGDRSRTTQHQRGVGLEAHPLARRIVEAGACRHDRG